MKLPISVIYYVCVHRANEIRNFRIICCKEFLRNEEASINQNHVRNAYQFEIETVIKFGNSEACQSCPPFGPRFLITSFVFVCNS